MNQGRRYPINLLEEINYETHLKMDDYRQYYRLEEAIIDLLVSPDINIYMGDEDWSLPITKLEAAMYLLRPEHLKYIREHTSNLQIDDRKFFFLLFLSCGDVGNINFNHAVYYKPEEFNELSTTSVYTQLSGINPPIDELELTEALMDKIWNSFIGNYHMYYVMLYSRNILEPSLLLGQLDGLENKDQALEFFMENYSFSGLSIANNDIATLVVEYLQNYRRAEEDEVLLPINIHSNELNRLLNIGIPYHKSRKQLISIYQYIIQYNQETPPHFVNLNNGKIVIEFLTNGEYDMMSKQIDNTGTHFDYYRVCLYARLIFSKENFYYNPQSLEDLGHYRYAIEFLRDVSNISGNMNSVMKFIKGLATLHLLYQCKTGRTSLTIDSNSIPLYKYPLKKLKQLLIKRIKKSPLVRRIPIYTKAEIPFTYGNVKFKSANLVYNVEKNIEIDYTVSILCCLLNISQEKYATIINRIQNKLKLFDTYGIIKTNFERNTTVTKKYVEETLKYMNTVYDFQSRSPLVLLDVVYKNYDFIEDRIVYKGEEEEREEDEIMEDEIMEREFNPDEDVNPYEYPDEFE